MRIFEISDNVLISSHSWDISEKNQLIHGIIVDKIKKGLSTKYLVKFEFKNETGHISLSSDNIFTDRPKNLNIENFNRKDGGIMRKFNIGDSVLVHHKYNSVASAFSNGTIIDELYFGIFKRYVVKYTWEKIERIDTYHPNNIYIDHTKEIKHDLV